MFGFILRPTIVASPLPCFDAVLQSLPRGCTNSYRCQPSDFKYDNGRSCVAIPKGKAERGWKKKRWKRAGEERGREAKRVTTWRGRGLERKEKGKRVCLCLLRSCLCKGRYIQNTTCLCSVSLELNKPPLSLPVSLCSASADRVSLHTMPVRRADKTVPSPREATYERLNLPST